MIDRQVGRGGMGTVYRARDDQTQAIVAVKIVRESSERFDREADLLARISHPGIVRHIAHGRTDAGEQFLVMEWLEGEDLQRRLARGPLPVAEALGLARIVAEALGEVHARGIVHRDVKPSNIWLLGGRADRPMLLDFGIARPVESWHLTVTGHIVGTPQYMAPEQIQTPREVDARTDVYGLAAVVFECVVGRPPFVGDNAIAVLAKVVIEEVPSLRELVAGVPIGFANVVQRSLSKRREERPADAHALAAELAAIPPDDTPIAETLAAPQPRARMGSVERRLVCVVIAEADGPIDATATPAQLSEELVRAKSVAKVHGMDVVPLAGGYVAMSSSSGVATDHARRAARYALALAAALPSSAISLAMGLGSVGPIPVGEAIDRAAALLKRGRAPGGGVRVDGVAASLLELACDLAPDGDGHILVGERRAGERPRTLLGRATTCVGRDRDLRVLEDLYAEACEDRVARAALVTAPAGAGKSRLRHELLARLRGSETSPAIAMAHCEMLRAGSPLDLLGRCVRSLAGVDIADTAERAQTTILDHVGMRIPDAPANLAEFVCELAGVPLPAGANAAIDAARADARVMGEQLLYAWLAFIKARCSASPCVLVLEDLHWGDAQTVRFLDAALRELESAPLFVLALARPDIHDRFPGLWRDRPLQEIRLGALARRACAQLVKEVLPQIDDAMLEKIIQHSEGNAFFLEELIRVASTDGNAPAPTSVIAMVQARLDALDGQARRVVRAASVFGETCRIAGVTAVLDTETDTELAVIFARLVDAEVVARRAEGEFAFRHALVREAAYAMLVDDDRRTAHGAAARWLESASERDALLLAGHYDAAGERADAARCWADAARQALEKNDFEAAVSRARRALDLQPATEVRATALSVIGRTSVCLGTMADALRDLEAALALTVEAALRVDLLRDMVRVGVYRQDGDFIRRTSHEALALATSLGRPDLQPEAIAGLAMADHCAGKCDEAATRFLEACEKSERPTLVHGLAGIIPYHCARFEEAVHWNDRLLRQALDARDGQAIAISHSNLALSYASLGRFGEADEHFVKAREVAERAGLTTVFARAISISTGWKIDVYDYGSARASAEEARHVGRAIEFSTPRVSALLDLSTIDARTDRPDSAAQLLDSISNVIATGTGFHGWVWRLREHVLRAEIAVARGQWAEAAELAAAAAARCDEYPRVKYAVAARVAQARALAALGRADESIPVLARAAADSARCREPSWQLRVHLTSLACGDGRALVHATRIAGEIEAALPAARARAFRASRELQILSR